MVISTHWLDCCNEPSALLLLLLLFWHAPLGVRSAIRRHQPPQRTVLSQVDCFVECEVIGSQISLDGVQPRDMGTPWLFKPRPQTPCTENFTKFGIVVFRHTSGQTDRHTLPSQYFEPLLRTK